MRHPSPLQPGHQGTQRAAREFALLNARGDAAAVGGPVKVPCIFELGGLPDEPLRACEAICGAPVVGHRSASEFSAHDADQPFGLRLACRHFTQHFQAGDDVGDQHVDRGQRMVWINALLGWARRGERRHAWVCVAGAAVLFGIMVGA